MSISKETIDFALNQSKKTSEKRISKYQKYEEDILYLREKGFSYAKIAQFLEATFHIENNKSLTALQSFIKVRERKKEKAIPNQVEKVNEKKQTTVNNINNDKSEAEFIDISKNRNLAKFDEY